MKQAPRLLLLPDNSQTNNIYEILTLPQSCIFRDCSQTFLLDVGKKWLNHVTT